MSVESDDSRSIPSFSLSPSKKYTGAAHSTSSFMTERVISSKQGASDGDDQLLSQMKGLQNRVANLGSRITSMYQRADRAEDAVFRPPVSSYSTRPPPPPSQAPSSAFRAPSPSFPSRASQQIPLPRPSWLSGPASTATPGARALGTATSTMSLSPSYHRPTSPSRVIQHPTGGPATIATDLGRATIFSTLHNEPSTQHPPPYPHQVYRQASYGGGVSRSSPYPVTSMAPSHHLGVQATPRIASAPSHSDYFAVNAHQERRNPITEPGSIIPQSTGGGGGGGGGGNRAQQLEDERIKSWISELRNERRRLEDRLMLGDPQGMRALDTRDDLEKQVMSLSRQRDEIEGSISSMADMQQTLAALNSEVDTLRAALHVESEYNAQHQEARESMEAALMELGKEIEEMALQQDKERQERKEVHKKYKKASSKATAAEEQGEKQKAEIQALHAELQSKEVALAEQRAAFEILQSSNSQLQVQMTSMSHSMDSRIQDLTRLLDEERNKGNSSNHQVELQSKEAAAAHAMVKEVSSRAEFLRAEREKLLKVVQAEQQQSASLRASVEALQSHIRTMDGQKQELDSSARIQIEALQKQYDVQAQTASKQHEVQVMAMEKQYVSVQKQYEQAIQSHEKLLTIHNSLRKERDEIWSEADRLRGEVAGLQRERDDLATKLSTLRGEVRYTMDDVVADRDQRVYSLNQQHERAVSELRVLYEQRIQEVTREGESKVKGLLDVTEQLRRELAECQQSCDKHRGAVVHLKTQLKESYESREDLVKELETEREFGRDLNRIVSQLRTDPVKKH